MSGKTFLDTNFLIYSLDAGSGKGAAALHILSTEPDLMLSTQVIGEFVTATVRKGRLSFPDAAIRAGYFMNALPVVLILPSTIRRAFEVKHRYGFSYYDSLIVATALENGCTRIYSEDMHGSQAIDTLTIINPFVGI